jgi:hypothetical protein
MKCSGNSFVHFFIKPAGMAIKLNRDGRKVFIGNNQEGKRSSAIRKSKEMFIFMNIESKTTTP